MNCLLGETSIKMQADYLGTCLTGEAQEWFYRNVFDRQVREWTLETVAQGLQRRFLHTLTHHHASNKWIVLDFRSPGMARVGNEVIPTGKVFFDELKDTDNNIATKGNIIQSSSVALDRE